jgi:predicted Zn-dependent protease
MLTKTEARNLCQEVLKRCGTNQAELILMVEDDALTRFANNTIHQNVAERNINLTLRTYVGKCSGMATTNRIEPAALDELVARALANAEASTEDPDFVGPVEPAEYTQVDALDQATAEYSPEQRAQEVGTVCRLAKEKGLNASGAFSTGTGEIAIANTKGLFAYHATTEADFQTVVMSDDSSGRAHASGWRVAKIPVESLGREAIDKAERGRNPQNIEPGEYTVVIDPYVTQDLLLMLNMGGMGARTVLEGRSWMNDRVGKTAMSPLVTIWDDGADPDGLPLPFDFEGVSKQRVEIVTEGTVMGPVYDRYTAGKAGTNSTGHALPPAFYIYSPAAVNLFMAPGDSSVAKMIRQTERGLYITRFWYTRPVHPRDAVITGMTRDGVFMIENGELTFPVKNLRFTQSYVQALAQVEAISQETRLLSSEFGNIATRVPALKINIFNFTGSTV